jgi:hypothetical protein
MTESGRICAVIITVTVASLSPLCRFALARPAADSNQAARYVQSLAAPALPPEARPLDPEAEKLAKALAERFGVRVLKIRKDELDGKPVYRVIVMKPGGNFDDAYAVDALIVDPATGNLVSQFRNEVSGYRLSAPADRIPRDSAVATTIRRESFRGAEKGR